MGKKNEKDVERIGYVIVRWVFALMHTTNQVCEHPKKSEGEEEEEG